MNRIEPVSKASVNLSLIKMSQGERQAGPGAEGSIMHTSSPITMPYYFGTPWLPSYSGDMHITGTSELEEFKTKLQALFRLYPLSEQQKVEILIGQLKGCALREANSWPASQKRTAEEIFKKLFQIFDIRTLSEIKIHFYARKQQPSETLRDFALSLQEALQAIKTCYPEEITHEDEALVIQFIEGVYGEQIKTQLKMIRLLNPTSTFLHFKETAIKILGTSSMQVQTRTYFKSATQHIQSLVIEDSLVALREQMAELIQGMTDIYKEIKSLKERSIREEKDWQYGKRNCFDIQCGATGNYRHVTDQFGEQGWPICSLCQKSGLNERDGCQQENVLRSPEAKEQPLERMESIGALSVEKQPESGNLNPVIQNQIKALNMLPAGDVMPASAEKVLGKVVWFHLRHGYGFINRDDTKRDIFVHHTAIQKNKPRKYLQSLEDREIVEFNVVKGEKGLQAANVTGPGGVPVQGSKYAVDCNQYQRYPNHRDPPSTYQQNYRHKEGGEEPCRVQSVFESSNPQPSHWRYCYPKKCPRRPHRQRQYSEVPEQSEFLWRTVGQKVQEKGGFGQHSLHEVVSPQSFAEPLCQRLPRKDDTNPSIVHHNRVDMYVYNRENTETVTDLEIEERLWFAEQNCLDYVSLNCSLPEESYSVVKKPSISVPSEYKFTDCLQCEQHLEDNQRQRSLRILIRMTRTVVQNLML